MSLTFTIRTFEALLGWSLMLQTLEYLRVQSMDQVAIWPILQQEIPLRPSWIKACLDKLFQPSPYRAMLTIRLGLCITLICGELGLIGAVLLFLTALVLLLRWRGAFNGGSDFMTLVGITGLLIAHVAGAVMDASWGWRAGFWYVALQTVSSYFVSGWVKLLRPEWRSGRALPLFLDSGVYGPLPKTSFFRHPKIALLCSWCFTLWEGCFPLALLDIRLAWVLCAAAALFHFLVFWFLGLNRFFWAWVSTFPAVIYCSGGMW